MQKSSSITTTILIALLLCIALTLSFSLTAHAGTMQEDEPIKHLTGQVTQPDGTGVEGIGINARPLNQDNPRGQYVLTDADGNFAFDLAAGEWDISVSYNSPYTSLVEYSPISTFDLRGYMGARQWFTEQLYQRILIVEDNIEETQHVNIVLKRANSTINGTLLNSDGTPAIGINAAVSAYSDQFEDSWVSAFVNPETAAFELDVTDGPWRIEYSLYAPYDDAYFDFYVERNVPGQVPVQVTIGDGVTLQKDLTLAPNLPDITTVPAPQEISFGHIEVTPQQPPVDEPFRLLMKGMHNVGCVPEYVSHELVDSTIVIEAVALPHSTPCGQAISSWSINLEMAGLDAGEYTVEVYRSYKGDGTSVHQSFFDRTLFATKSVSIGQEDLADISAIPTPHEDTPFEGHIELTPQQPQVDEPFRLLMTGMHNVTCVPEYVSHELVDSTIVIEAVAPSPDTICGQSIEPWRIDLEMAGLDAGEYTVEIYRSYEDEEDGMQIDNPFYERTLFATKNVSVGQAEAQAITLPSETIFKIYLPSLMKN